VGGCAEKVSSGLIGRVTLLSLMLPLGVARLAVSDTVRATGAGEVELATLPLEQV
jgi:hypothetical protein